MIVTIITSLQENNFTSPNSNDLWQIVFYLFIGLGIMIILQALMPFFKKLFNIIEAHFKRGNYLQLREKNNTAGKKKFRLEIIQWQHGGIQLGFNKEKSLDVEEIGSILQTALFTLEKKDPLLHRLLLYYTLETLNTDKETIDLMDQYLHADEKC